jgi:UDP-N-acetylglucosamine transferase subunit ALG13
MILATVGTHEDQFNRLLVELNRLVEVGAIKERVVVQSGYCDADAPAVECFDQLPFDELQSLMAEANVIITHGGPASIMQAMAHGKVPIVVPRQSKFGEHVDDHQCRFAEKMRERVLVVLDIEELGQTIEDWAERVSLLPETNVGPDRAAQFSTKLDALCRDLLSN